jgi:6-phosphogluconolactonase
VAVDPVGRFVYVTVTDGILAYQIGSDGALTAVPGSPFPLGIAGMFPTSVAVDLLGRFVYVADVFAGTINGEILSAYQVAPDGSLTPVPGSPFALFGISGTPSVAVSP